MMTIPAPSTWEAMQLFSSWLLMTTTHPNFTMIAASSLHWRQLWRSQIKWSRCSRCRKKSQSYVNKNLTCIVKSKWSSWIVETKRDTTTKVLSKLVEKLCPDADPMELFTTCKHKWDETHYVLGEEL
jgi:hypothetical protein